MGVGIEGIGHLGLEVGAWGLNGTHKHAPGVVVPQGSRGGGGSQGLAWGLSNGGQGPLGHQWVGAATIIR